VKYVAPSKGVNKTLRGFKRKKLRGSGRLNGKETCIYLLRIRWAMLCLFKIAVDFSLTFSNLAVAFLHLISGGHVTVMFWII
jgi:hypothetical protein